MFTPFNRRRLSEVLFQGVHKTAVTDDVSHATACYVLRTVNTDLVTLIIVAHQITARHGFNRVHKKFTSRSHSCFYGLLGALTSLITHAHSTLPTALCRHLLTFTPRASFSTVSNHLILGLPIFSYPPPPPRALLSHFCFNIIFSG